MAANLSPIEYSDVANDIGNVIVSDIVNVVVSDIVNDVRFWDHIRYRLRCRKWYRLRPFLHFHHGWEGIGFMWKMTRNFHQIFTFWGPLSQKKTVFTKVSVCLSVVDVCGITLDRIIRLNWASAHFIRAEKVRTSSLTSHIQSKLRDWALLYYLNWERNFVNLRKLVIYIIFNIIKLVWASVLNYEK